MRTNKATDGLPESTAEALAKLEATCYMIDYLAETRGLSRTEAYVLCSLAGDLEISEVVDEPHIFLSIHMPKGIFRK